MVTSLLKHVPLENNYNFEVYYDQYRFIIETMFESPKCLTILEYLLF